ncbi:putative adenylyltransferase HVO_0558 [Desulfosarcina cetonica]|nr:putative adenylyltransferase HVO_0558 [Desulfosarcina cetonica]
MTSTIEEKRFLRQIALPEVGREGQARLNGAKVFIVGAGGLASSAAYYLAAAGIGTLAIADDDCVEESNLNRQILHDASRIGMGKAASARMTLQALHPALAIDLYPRLATAQAMATAFRGYDLVVDCTDNYAARYHINAACLEGGTPWIHGAVFGFEGQTMTIIPGKGPCYRCLYAAHPGDGDAVVPVMGVSPGIVGIIQAAEAIKVILGIGSPLVGRMLYVDLLAMRFEAFSVPKDPNCPDCGSVGP